MNKTACLVCSVASTGMVDILDTHLEVVYEMLTELKVHNETHYLCFICNRRLEQCYQLQQLAIAQNHRRYNNNSYKKQNEHKSDNPIITLPISRVTIPCMFENLTEDKLPNVKQEMDEGDVFENLQEQDIRIKEEVSDSGSLSRDMRDETENDTNKEMVYINKYMGGVCPYEANFDSTLNHSYVNNIKSNEFDNLQKQDIKIEECSDSVSLQSRNTNYLEIGKDSVDTNKHMECVNKYMCDISSYEANTESNLNHHLFIHKGVNKKLYKCKSYTYVNNIKPNVLSHELSHDSCKSYTCDICKKTFTRKNLLIYHIRRTHTSDKSYGCHTCKKTFLQRSSLNKHKKTHTSYKPCVCDVCNKTYSFRSHLIIHKWTHEGNKPYFCDVCNKTFSQSCNLIAHKRIHTGDKPYVCDVCDKTFSQSCNLLVHKRTHTGNKPYVCNVCNKTFSHRSSLMIHKRTHTGEKPYSCDVCNKTFSHRSSLIIHKRTHTGKKPYSCDVCNKTFSDSSHLTTHRRTHTGDKPYVCNVCKKRFSNSSHLTTHKRTHTGDKPYGCDVCKKTFSQSSILMRHKRIHTGDKP